MARPAIGVMFRREHPPSALPGFARRVEAAGFDELWLVEDCFFAGGFALSATALAATERIAVGLGILPGVARNAAFAAMEIAALAGLHPGRFLPGIGHGVKDWMRQVGALPVSQLAALEETIAAVRALLRGETVFAEGRHVRLREVRLDQPPAEPPPVFAGVMGARSLRLAGRVADGTVLAEGASDAYIQWARERIAEGTAEAGRDGPHWVVVYAWCHLDPD
ncbi:MAG: LLM class flavin-dependent oxidoreductase, partial [Chloroflexota bacterium]|nr:LLM class flavin-dependent oxidoreductase [Chloroflexota bacterium]